MKKIVKKITSLKDWTKLREFDPDYVASGLIINLTEELSAIMNDRQMNRSALAKKLKCSTSYITKLLRGEENLTIKKIAHIASILGLKPEINLDSKKQDVYVTTEYTIRQFNSVVFNGQNFFGQFYIDGDNPYSVQDFDSNTLIQNQLTEGIVARG